MTTSKSYSFSPSVGDVLLGALRILRVIQEGQSPSSYMQNNALQALEFIIKRMSIDQVPVWARYSITVPIVVAQNPYTVGPGLNIDIGPAGTLTATMPPVDIFRVNYKYLLDGQETKLEPNGRQDYLDYALKGSAGIPNSWYYEKQNTFGNLYLYPVPDSTSAGDHLVIDVQRYIYDAGALTNGLDMPLELIHYLKWAVAEELMCEYEQPDRRAVMISARATSLYEVIKQINGDKSSVYFLPDTRWEDDQWA